MKWGILIKVLPATGSFVSAKLLIGDLGWEIWAFDTQTAALFSAATFTIALVLSGTLADYRASEAMPLQIATALETIQDTNQTIATAYPDYPAAPVGQALARIAAAILDWLKNDGEFTAIEAEIDRLNPLLAPLTTIVGGTVLVNRIQTEQAKIRSIAWQMQILRDTDFLAPAYVLLWLFIAASTVALLLIGAREYSENLIVSTFIFTSFFYLLCLIRDLDNPFDYAGKSCVDVDLSVLAQTRDRLQHIDG